MCVGVSGSSEGNLRFFKAWKTGRGGRLTAYNKAKKVCSCTIHHAKREAEKVALDKIRPRMLGIYIDMPIQCCDLEDLMVGKLLRMTQYDCS